MKHRPHHKGRAGHRGRGRCGSLCANKGAIRTLPQVQQILSESRSLVSFGPVARRKGDCLVLARWSTVRALPSCLCLNLRNKLDWRVKNVMRTVRPRDSLMAVPLFHNSRCTTQGYRGQSCCFRAPSPKESCVGPSLCPPRKEVNIELAPLSTIPVKQRTALCGRSIEEQSASGPSFLGSPKTERLREPAALFANPASTTTASEDEPGPSATHKGQAPSELNAQRYAEWSVSTSRRFTPSPSLAQPMRVWAVYLFAAAIARPPEGGERKRAVGLPMLRPRSGVSQHAVMQPLLRPRVTQSCGGGRQRGAPYHHDLRVSEETLRAEARGAPKRPPAGHAFSPDPDSSASPSRPPLIEHTMRESKATATSSPEG